MFHFNVLITGGNRRGDDNNNAGGAREGAGGGGGATKTRSNWYREANREGDVNGSGRGYHHSERHAAAGGERRGAPQGMLVQQHQLPHQQQLQQQQLQHQQQHRRSTHFAEPPFDRQQQQHQHRQRQHQHQHHNQQQHQQLNGSPQGHGDIRQWRQEALVSVRAFCVFVCTCARMRESDHIILTDIRQWRQ